MSNDSFCGTGPQSFRGGVSCTVLSEANARGQKIWAMRRRGRVRVLRSMSNAPVEVRVLRYGRTYRGFGIRCASRRRGLLAATARATGSSSRVGASASSDRADDGPVVTAGPASRSAIVDHAALADALARGTIAGAGIDILEPERLPPDHPLLAQERLLATPHTAFYPEESVIGQLVLEQPRQQVSRRRSRPAEGR